MTRLMFLTWGLTGLTIAFAFFIDMAVRPYGAPDLLQLIAQSLIWIGGMLFFGLLMLYKEP